MIDLTMIGADNWLKLNSKLQLKKNAVRKELKSRGVLVKGAINKFDNYSFKIDLYKVSDIYEKPNTNDNTSDVQRNINKKYSHQNEIKMTHFSPILSQLINTERGVHISCSILNNDILGSN